LIKIQQEKTDAFSEDQYTFLSYLARFFLE